MNLDPRDHNQDSDCTVSTADDCCVVCGAYHGDPCPLCDGKGYHRPHCQILKEEIDLQAHALAIQKGASA